MSVTDLAQRKTEMRAGGGGLDLAAGAPLFVCVFMAGVLLKLLLLL